MKLTRQEEIAFIILGTLAEKRGSLVPLSVIAGEHGISAVFLKKIARDLVRHGLIEAKEGANGGYRLQRPPGSIAMSDIISGALPAETRASGTYPVCPLTPSCLPQRIRQALSDKLYSYLSSVSLSDVLGGIR